MKLFWILLQLFLSAKLHAYPQMMAERQISALEQGTIKLAGSHIIILQADIENIWGSYYFAVSNQTGGEASFDLAVRLPQETVDFQAGEGLQNEELQLFPDGRLGVRKNFPSGLTLLGINFKVPTKGKGEASLTLVPSYDMAQLFIATTQVDLLAFRATGFESGLPPMLAGGRYAGIKGEGIKKGQTVQVNILGIPSSPRELLKMLGWMTGLVLLIALALLTSMLRKERETVGGSI
ncbi:MAG: hypothetical protein HYW48_11685 [Deltaproteobacteria bacterium]|nr:hypothetical protein [Deltaproteobacteria bacterium]